MKVILASTSKYRASLLEKLNINFTQKASLFDEDSFDKRSLPPRELAEKLAFEKANSLKDKAIIIGGDQVCALEDKILSKPGNFENAKEQLLEMSGKEHQLITCICVLDENRNSFVSTVVTSLKMREVSEEEVERYLKFDEPYDCAGSYKIESLGISLFENIDTADFTSIVGMPLIELGRILRKLGLHIP